MHNLAHRGEADYIAIGVTSLTHTIFYPISGVGVIKVQKHPPRHHFHIVALVIFAKDEVMGVVGGKLGQRF